MALLPYECSAMTAGLDWLTSVSPTYSSEHRQSLREIPHLYMTAIIQLVATETRTITAIIETSEAEVELPDWRYAQRGTATFIGPDTDIDLDVDHWYPVVGDQFLIWNSVTDYYVATMSALNVASVSVIGALPIVVTTQTWIIPLLALKLTSAPTFALTGADTVDLTLIGVVDTYKDLSSFATALPTLDSVPVLASRDLLLSVGSHRLVTNYAVFDSEYGAVALSQLQNTMQTLFFLAQTSYNTQTMFNMEAMLHVLRGRNTAFWKPSWLPDFVPQGTSGIGTTLICEPGVPVVDGPLSAIAIAYTNGDVTFHVVSNAVSTLTETTLTLNPALTVATSKANVTTVSRAEKHRLDTDRVDLIIQPGGVTDMSIPTIRIPA